MGRQSGSTQPEQAWVYTVYRTRAELFRRGADYSDAGRIILTRCRIIPPRGRQVAHASSVSFPTQSTPPPEDAKDFGGVDVICAYSRQAELCAQKSWEEVVPPLGPAPVVSSATGWPRLHRRERAGAEGRLRGLWG